MSADWRQISVKRSPETSAHWYELVTLATMTHTDTPVPRTVRLFSFCLSLSPPLSPSLLWTWACHSAGPCTLRGCFLPVTWQGKYTQQTLTRSNPLSHSRVFSFLCLLHENFRACGVWQICCDSNQIHSMIKIETCRLVSASLCVFFFFLS